MKNSSWCSKTLYS